ncbi:hypothetical protein BX666DRAFT_2027844 [Dichotomocladium elegans]|nr:hypothetical protein BX666DRAFT_2027844 [Dichotomocladium elegans]
MEPQKLCLFQRLWDDQDLSGDGVFQVKSIIIDHIEERLQGDGNIGVSAIVRVTLQSDVYREDCGYGTSGFVAKDKISAYRKAACDAIKDSIRRILQTFGPMGVLYQHEPVTLGKCPEPLFPAHQSRLVESPLNSNGAAHDYDDTHILDNEDGHANGTAKELFEAFDTPNIAPGEEEMGGTMLAVNDLKHATDIGSCESGSCIQTLDMFVDGEVSMADALELFSDDEVKEAL